MATRNNGVMLAAARGIEGVLEQEFMKGEYAGIALILAIPEARIADLKEQLKDLNEEIENG